MSYYHGGRPGLKPGDLILPPSATGVETFVSICRKLSTRISYFANPRLSPPDYHDDQVYITDSLAIACEYAWDYTLFPLFPGKGAVYRVTPLGRMRRDRGTWYRGNFECARARVDAVERENVAPPEPDTPDEKLFRYLLAMLARTYLTYRQIS